MPKTKPSSSQLSFIEKRKVPQMPEGYYSSGPNPNLAKFVEEHSTPYDPASDTYDVPPFDKPITTTKATAIYNMHTYWSKKPHDAIQQYIRHYTRPGDLVLDPFCGSGGTALAALMEGRKAIAIDLSPAATFITKNYCTPVDVDELQRAFEELKAKVKPEMDWLYETRCDRCGGRATTAYTVYSQVFECPRCNQHIPLFDCPEVPGVAKNGNEKMLRVCPHCQKEGHQEEISTRGKKFGAEPVLVSYLCQEGCKPQRGERRHDDKNEKKEYFEKYDLAKIREIEGKEIPYWYPKNRMMNSPKDQERWGDLWRSGIHEGVSKVSDFFTKRNLIALSSIFSNIVDKTSILSFVFEGNILSATKMQQFREAGGGFAKGTYYIPQIYIEREQLGCFERKYSDINKGITEINQIQTTSILISTQSATDDYIQEADSIDYIFTDPPYGGTVLYGELNFVWEVWLGFDTNWHDKEIIVSDTRRTTLNEWSELMHQAMKECFRVLKPGRWISLCYHDTSEGTWQLVQDIMTEVGFIPESTNSTLFIDAGQKSYNQLMAEKVTKRDLVINFRKPRPGELSGALTLTGEEDRKTFNEKAHAILTEALERHPGQSADRLYDELVSRMVRKGSFERHNFDELLRQVAEPVSETKMKNLFEPADPDLFGGHETVRWYLKDSAAALDEAEDRRESEAAKKLESYMTGFLQANAGQAGVHYSDLFEQYLPIKDKPRRLLQDWLVEYFYKTDEGTWRPPQGAEERDQKTALRSSGSLRKIRRFVTALNEGVPPGEKDRPANAATLADWIYQCRRAGLYEAGRALYEKGGLRFDALSGDLKLQVEEDYQVCVRRGAEKAAQEQGRGRKRKAAAEQDEIEFGGE